MTSFEINYRLCLFCCKSINYSEINYQGHHDVGCGDYFNCSGDGDTEKPLVSRIIDSEDSFGGFMEMLGRYSGGVELSGGLKVKELNCCENCLIIISRCGELYEQLKKLEKEIEWKVGSVMEIMKVGSRRMEGIKKEAVEVDLEGNATFFGGIRKEIINNCLKMLKGTENMEPPLHKPESPLPSTPPPPTMPLPRKREKCVPDDRDTVDDTDTTFSTAPATKKSRIMIQPENIQEMDKDTQPKTKSSAKAIPLDNNNNSNNEPSSISTVAMDTLEPEGGQGQGQVTFTLSRLHINKDPSYPLSSSWSSTTSSFFGSLDPGPGPAITITNSSQGARAHHQNQATANHIN